MSVWDWEHSSDGGGLACYPGNILGLNLSIIESSAIVQTCNPCTWGGRRGCGEIQGHSPQVQGQPGLLETQSQKVKAKISFPN